MISSLFGGSKPIPSRIVLDFVTICLLGHACFISHDDEDGTKGTASLVLAASITIGTAGLTSRWTISFPMFGIGFFHLLRTLPILEIRWIQYLMTCLQFVLLVATVLLSTLFPAVELPPIEGPYRVGVVDSYLPINRTDSGSSDDNATESSRRGPDEEYVLARILYPTTNDGKVSRIRYLREDTARLYLRETMKIGAPPPLRTFDWMLHNWLLIQVSAEYHAQPAKIDGGLPVIVFSHGLGGVSTTYTYQTMSLAANGFFVVVIDHSDGSAPYMKTKSGKELFTDEIPVKLFSEGKKYDSIVYRRKMTEQRVDDMIAALRTAILLNERDTLEGLHGISFRNHLNVRETYFMGHSFGGAAALTAAFRTKDRVRAVVAHEPAVDWLPDDARRSLFPTNIMKDCPLEFDGGTGGLSTEQTPAGATADELNMMLLFSHEWYEQKWAKIDIIEWMHSTGKFKKETEFGKIEAGYHNEFSDVCCITPPWLGRLVGTTGSKSPIETAQEIKCLTLSFLRKLQAEKTTATKANDHKI